MTTKKAAWVSGLKPLGYTLNVSASRAPAFVALDASKMGDYRAAQMVANAINAAVREPAKRAPHCATCGSARVTLDAAAVWSKEQSAWILAGTHDNATCEDCNDDCHIVWRRAK